MNALQKRFEKQVIRKRNRLEKKGQRMAYMALLAQIPVEIYTIDGAIRQMEAINDEPIKDFFKKYYGMAGKEIGMMYFQFMQKKDEFLENVFMAEMERYALEEAGYRIVEITKTTRELLISATREAVFQANSQGLGIEKTKNLILQYCRDAIKPSRARAIAQTELITASNRASFAAAETTGLTFKKFWSTSGLPNIRPSHLQAEFDSIGGISMDQPFSNGLMFPGDPKGPAEEVINCYTGDMEIKSAIVGAQRLFYSGDIVEIITVGGKRLTVTPNHYILTENGFIPARLINNGDQLVCNTENVKTISVISGNGNNVNNKKSFISNVFHSLIMKFGSKFAPVVGLDFDGDGFGGNGNIDIVEINRELLSNLKFSRKNACNFGFKKTNPKSILIERFCALNFGFQSMFHTTSSIMSFFNLIFSLFISHLRPFKFFAFGLRPHHYTLFAKMPIERDSYNAGFIRELIKTNPTLIHLDQVVNIRNFNFSGHVYDFTSLTGTNIVNNIYTSNCRCTIINLPVG